MSERYGLISVSVFRPGRSGKGVLAECCGSDTLHGRSTGGRGPRFGEPGPVIGNYGPQEVEPLSTVVRATAARDRGFLVDRYNFGNKMRSAVAHALWTGVEAASESEDPEAGRLGVLLVARMFNEYMGSVEDLAALIHAVKHKKPNGIMYEYVNYSSTDIGDVYADVDTWSAAPPLADVLGITAEDVGKMKAAHAAAGDDAEAVLKWLDEIPVHLQGLAKTYRAVFDPALVGAAVVNPVDHKGKPARSMQAAHNKIKHGGLVVEDLSDIVTFAGNELAATGPAFKGKLLILVQCPITQDALEPLVASVPVRKEWVSQMLRSIDSMKNMSEAIEATCASLIQEGIWTY